MILPHPHRCLEVLVEVNYGVDGESTLKNGIKHPAPTQNRFNVITQGSVSSFKGRRQLMWECEGKGVAIIVRFELRVTSCGKRCE